MLACLKHTRNLILAITARLTVCIKLNEKLFQENQKASWSSIGAVNSAILFYSVPFHSIPFQVMDKNIKAMDHQLI